MRYRRLGRTEWMVAEVGLAAGALAGADEALTTAALQAALDVRIGVFAVEAGAPGRARAALLARIAGDERPRLTVVGRLAALTDSALAAEVESLAAGDALDVLTLSDAATALHLDAAESLRERGVARALGIATADRERAAEALATARIDVAIVPFAILDAALVRAATAVDAALLVEVASEAELLATLARPIAGALLLVPGREALVNLVAVARYAEP